jgi:hypothetical protein
MAKMEAKKWISPGGRWASTVVVVRRPGYPVSSLL